MIRIDSSIIYHQLVPHYTTTTTTTTIRLEEFIDWLIDWWTSCVRLLYYLYNFKNMKHTRWEAGNLWQRRYREKNNCEERKGKTILYFFVSDLSCNNEEWTTSCIITLWLITKTIKSIPYVFINMLYNYSTRIEEIFIKRIWYWLSIQY